MEKFLSRKSDSMLSLFGNKHFWTNNVHTGVVMAISPTLNDHLAKNSFANFCSSIVPSQGRFLNENIHGKFGSVILLNL